MEIGNTKQPQNILLDDLKIVGGIRFTPKEIDIITYVLFKRNTKAILSVLPEDITAKAIETHISNIMRKLRCNLRGDIADFIEKSGKFNLFRQHYQNLLIWSDFKKYLQEINALRQHKPPIYCTFKNKQGKEHVIQKIENHLKFAGIKIIPVNEEEKVSNINKEHQLIKNDTTAKHNIYIVTEELIEQFHLDRNTKNLGPCCK